MAFDISRFTFDPWKDYSGVLVEQGRVQVDADWNEWHAELARRIQAGTLDLMGHAAYPSTTPAAFQIAASTAPNTISIGCGRMYVDGLLAENHGLEANALWDPALSELSGSPQPAAQPPPPLTTANSLDYAAQPYFSGAALPTDTGAYLFYLDVWLRPVTWLQDPELIDKAIAVDTSGRVQVVWQVKWLAFPDGGTYSCATPDSEIDYPQPPSAGRLTTGLTQNAPSGPCCLSTDTGFTGMENQAYRLEIHQGGPADPADSTAARLKWSRDNASVYTGVTDIAAGTNTAGQPASVLTVMSLGRDQVLGFASGDWIEILDDAAQLAGKAGAMCQIDSIDVPSRSITLTGSIPPALGLATDSADLVARSTRIIRWDQSGTVYTDTGAVWCELAQTGGLIPVPDPGTTILLENGITASFDANPAGGSFNVGDFWIFAARTADGSVEELSSAPPLGIHHHYTKLAVVSFDTGSATDCRNPFGPPAEDGCGCCTCTVGMGGQYSSIQQAIESLPTDGGEVCILPGRYFERVFVNGLHDIVIRGCGPHTRLASPSLGAAAAGEVTEDAPTTESGFAAVVTVTGSKDIEIRSLAVEAAHGEVGILLDRIAADSEIEAVGRPAGTVELPTAIRTAIDVDITIEETVVIASTLPAIYAADCRVLRIAENVIATADVPSIWPALRVNGADIRVEGNWVGLLDSAATIERLPDIVSTDLVADARAAGGETTEGAKGTKGAMAPGGIQIAGPSRDVVVVDNEIEGGARNGITLGSFVLLDENGADTGEPTGVLVELEEDCATKWTIILPRRQSGERGGSLGAAGPLVEITIDRNRIRGTGLCGIGPVGFFDLETTSEVVSVQNLTITANELSNIVLRPVVTEDAKVTGVGYAAISIPDVENLVIRDNAISEFGATPSDPVSGIFVLHGELVEISRNQIIETDTWDPGSDGPASGPRAGILVGLATPPALNSPFASFQTREEALRGYGLDTPVYQGGLPALRVEHNVVRVAVGLALEAIGFGSFSIVNNAFSSGELLPKGEVGAAATVRIANLGGALDSGRSSRTSSSFFQTLDRGETAFGAGSFGSSPTGSVVFTENICQLESLGGSEARASVFVSSLDHVTFAANHCRVSAPARCVSFDALVSGATVQIETNRLQEALDNVLASGMTTGMLNVTTGNISTYCLLAFAPTPASLAYANNLTLVDPERCAGFQKQLLTIRNFTEG